MSKKYKETVSITASVLFELSVPCGSHAIFWGGTITHTVTTNKSSGFSTRILRIAGNHFSLESNNNFSKIIWYFTGWLCKILEYLSSLSYYTVHRQYMQEFVQKYWTSYDFSPCVSWKLLHKPWLGSTKNNYSENSVDLYSVCMILRTKEIKHASACYVEI